MLTNLEMILLIDLQGYEDVTPAMHGDFSKLPPDGYICQIVHAELTNSKAGNPMLVLSVDIAEGEFKGFFQDAAKRFNKWDNAAVFRQLIFDSNRRVSGFFKGLLTCFAQSNPSFKFNPHTFHEQILHGLFIGFIFAQEEYQRRDGSIATRVVVKFPRNVADIRNKNFSVPDIKRLAPAAESQKPDVFAGTPVSNFDVPF